MKSCMENAQQAEDWCTDFCGTEQCGILSISSRPPSSCRDSCSDWSDGGTAAENSDSREVTGSASSVLSTHWRLRESQQKPVDYERDVVVAVPESATCTGNTSPAEATTTSSAPPLPLFASEEDEANKIACMRLEENATSQSWKSSMKKRISASRSSGSTDERSSAVPRFTSPACAPNSDSLGKGMPNMHGGENGKMHDESYSHLQRSEEGPSPRGAARSKPSLLQFEDDSQIFSDELQRSLAHVCRTAELNFFNMTAGMQRRMAEQLRVEQQQHELRLRESRAEVEATRAELIGMRSAKEATEDQLMRVFAYVRRRLLRQEGRERRETTFKAWLTFVEREKTTRHLTRLFEAQRIYRKLQRAFHSWRAQCFRATAERQKERATQAAQEAAERQIAALQSERRKETQVLIETRQKLRQEAFQRQQLQRTLQILFLQGATAVCSAPVSGDSKMVTRTPFSETPLDVHPGIHTQNSRLPPQGSTTHGPDVSSVRTTSFPGEMKSPFLTSANISKASHATAPFSLIGLADSSETYLRANIALQAAAAAPSKPSLSDQQQPGRSECSGLLPSTSIGVPASPVANVQVPYSITAHAVGANRFAQPPTEATEQRQSGIRPPMSHKIQPSGDCNLAVVGRTIGSTSPHVDTHQLNVPACHMFSEHTPDPDERDTKGPRPHPPFLMYPSFTSQGVEALLQPVNIQYRGQTPRFASLGSDQFTKTAMQGAPERVTGSELQLGRGIPPTQHWVLGKAEKLPVGEHGIYRDAGTCQQGTQSDTSGINNHTNTSLLESQKAGASTPPRPSSEVYSWRTRDRPHRYEVREKEFGRVPTRMRVSTPTNISKNKASRLGRISPPATENLTPAPPVPCYVTESSGFSFPSQVTFGPTAASFANKKTEKSTFTATRECRVKPNLSKKQANWTRSNTPGS
ncbi:hypothetical protein TGPRC2_218900 [Toxoplasma gondii TgCatPRC2]|uniref:Centrosomal protein POC5 n=1 Tax=Toxoplasma gondii TgCatPRC2 TaxID=1130821 RepID=A0A151HCR4_TOXGO|nr:hypothetical protein TGPRC2_218900 [Toxoplasma gondii TgCatPRC2]